MWARYVQRSSSSEPDISGRMPVDPPLRLQTTETQPIPSHKPQESASQVRLSRLDGTPYVVPRKLRKAGFVEEAYEGQQPAVYTNKSPYASLRQLGSLFYGSKKRTCGTCGRRQPTLYGSNDRYGAGIVCRRCSKRSVTDPLRTRAPVVVSKPRSTSDGSSVTLTDTPTLSYNVSSDASWSKRACNRCGRKRKLSSTNDDTRSLTESQSTILQPDYLGSADQPMTSMNMPTSPPQLLTGVPERESLPSQITSGQTSDIIVNVVPPAAVSERPHSNRVPCPGLEVSPLLQTNSPRLDVVSRRSISVSSMASSLVRSISKRHQRSQDHTEEYCAGSAANRDIDQGTNSLINMIANAIRGNQDQDYSRLDDEIDGHQRPTSPFSFVGEERDESIELVHMGPSSPVAETLSEEKEAPVPVSNSTIHNPFHDRERIRYPEHSDTEPPSYSTLLEASRLPEVDTQARFLSEAPTLVRFKSLKSGMQRAGSLARSTSLKRLDSLKSAARFWYSTDMATECIG